MELIIPIRLICGAFIVFQLLKEEDKRDFDRIKAALYTAFAADGFMAFDQFVEQRLHHGESVDVYLAGLRRLSVLFEGISDQGLACASMRGLPDRVKSLLRASNRMDGLSIDQQLARVRASMKDNTIKAGLAIAAVQATQDKTKSPDCRDLYDFIICHRCNGPNHFAKDRKRPGTGKRAPKIRCYKCKVLGHIDRPVCAAITIDKPDFHAEFDQNKKIWVVSWKWSKNQTPPELGNKAAEYLVPKQLRAEFDNELRTWIDNGWMIPYPEEERGPLKGLIPLMAVF